MPHGGRQGQVKMGDIYWVDFGPAKNHEQALRRPAVVVSRTEVNEYGDTIVMVPLSTTLSKACAFRVKIPASHMLPEPGEKLTDSVALCDHIKEVDKSRLERKAGRLTDTALRGLGIGLSYLFDL